MTDLVGASEIAERLHLSHSQNVHVWRRRYPDFPQPVAALRQTLVWSWNDVEKWARATGRIKR